MKWFVLTLLFPFALSFAANDPDSRTDDSQAPIRIGIIGLDTSHAIEFTRILNDSASKDHVPGARVVAAFG